MCKLLEVPFYYQLDQIKAITEEWNEEIWWLVSCSSFYRNNNCILNKINTFMMESTLSNARLKASSSILIPMPQEREIKELEFRISKILQNLSSQIMKMWLYLTKNNFFCQSFPLLVTLWKLTILFSSCYRIILTY